MEGYQNMIDEISKTQQQYNSTSTSIPFPIFKKQQKMEIARTISKEFCLNDLLQYTIYILPNTNSIYLDYPILKTYANPDNFEEIIKYIIQLFNWVIQKHGIYEIHFNMKSFTISAVDRYKPMIDVLLNICKDTNYSIYLTKMCIYNPPSVMDNITKMIYPFVDKIVKDKIVIFTKDESDNLLDNLFQSVNIS